jgi:hypothetical protein
MGNRYLVLLEFLLYSNSHLAFKLEGKIKFIAVTYTGDMILKLYVTGKIMVENQSIKVHCKAFMMLSITSRYLAIEDKVC